MRSLGFVIIVIFFLLLTTSMAHASEYIAFSLKVAQERIASSRRNKDYRKLDPEVFCLGGITAVRGLVYDRKTGDVILVGERNSNRAPLTLDDFVVALRARFIHGKWPLVSIDPTEETKKTDMQIVRFEGGIEDTQFGEDLFDADYRLKKIGMGLLSSGVREVKSKWDLGVKAIKEDDTKESRRISSRFWFYPLLPDVAVRGDVVALKGLKVGVFTEVLAAEIDGKKIDGLSTFHDVTGDLFARMVSDNFDDLAGVHISFLRLQGLVELVALSKAIEEMDDKPYLSYWLRNYQIKRVQTRTELKVLRKKEDFTVSKVKGIHRGSLEISGGVQLKAIALRLKAGEVTALKEAVLRTRPNYESLSWSFIVGEWLIPTSPEMVKMEDIVLLFTQAVFLQEKRHYDDAVTLYGKIIELVPYWDWPYYNRGIAYSGKSQIDQAIYNYTRALDINPSLTEAYNNRGVAFFKKGNYEQAISDYNKVLEINPMDATAYHNRGVAFAHKDDYDQAISNYNKALDIYPRYSEAYNNRGVAFFKKGNYDQAICDCTQALEINPRLAEAYNSRGNAYCKKGSHDQAISDYTRALEINPRLAEAFNNRGNAYFLKGNHDQAIFNYSRTLEINSKKAEVYFNRGIIYYLKKEYKKAFDDFCEAQKMGIQVPPEIIEAIRKDSGRSFK